MKWNIENIRILTLKIDYELCNKQSSTEMTTRKKARRGGSMMYKGAAKLRAKCMVYSTWLYKKSIGRRKKNFGEDQCQVIKDVADHPRDFAFYSS